MAKRLGIYIFHGAEVIDWAGPVGVFAVARRLDPELDVFLIGDSLSPVMATGNLSVNPRYSLDQQPDMDAFLIPGGIGSRAEMHNGRLLDFVKSLPEKTLLVSVCTGSWVYGVLGLLDGLAATNRKNGDPAKPLSPSTVWRRSLPSARSTGTGLWTQAGSSLPAALLQAWRWAYISLRGSGLTRVLSMPWCTSWNMKNSGN